MVKVNYVWYCARVFASIGMFVIGVGISVYVLIGHPVSKELIAAGAGYGFMAAAAALLMGTKPPSK